jgi:hypothetical protein
MTATQEGSSRKDLASDKVSSRGQCTKLSGPPGLRNLASGHIAQCMCSTFKEEGNIDTTAPETKQRRRKKGLTRRDERRKELQVRVLFLFVLRTVDGCLRVDPI